MPVVGVGNFPLQEVASSTTVAVVMGFAASIDAVNSWWSAEVGSKTAPVTITIKSQSTTTSSVFDHRLEVECTTIGIFGFAGNEESCNNKAENLHDELLSFDIQGVL